MSSIIPSATGMNGRPCISRRPQSIQPRRRPVGSRQHLSGKISDFPKFPRKRGENPGKVFLKEKKKRRERKKKVKRNQQRVQVRGKRMWWLFPPPPSARRSERYERPHELSRVFSSSRKRQPCGVLWKSTVPPPICRC